MTDLSVEIYQIKVKLLKERLSLVEELTGSCRLCPRECGVNRLEGEKGVCGIGAAPVYSSANLHYGEEPPISGYKGSGTIFMTGCNLNCKFCQNYPISQLRNGNIINTEILAALMLDLQDRGAHNINFVTPTHQALAIFRALIIAYEKGLRIPLVYNSGGYESLEMLKLWDGIFDVYMPDSKYSDNDTALKISNISEYTKHNQAALKEMQRQVGVLEMDDDGIARRGMLVRHLVLPGGLAGSREALKFIAEEVSKETYISLMSQYFPAHKAVNHKILRRRVSRIEYQQAMDALEEFGLENGWTQPNY
ncbi:4Fe-4S cluster-binding domain-containing protein [bacterium]|nr:4Fe-4S cluster-binding domain-containing protein [bacterium]